MAGMMIDLKAVQREHGLSDGKLAKALGVTRQTVINWRRSGMPLLAQNALIWLLELRRIDPSNCHLPAVLRGTIKAYPMLCSLFFYPGLPDGYALALLCERFISVIVP